MLAAYTDGACRVSNPGICSCAWVLYTGNDQGIFGGEYLGPELHTNNFAEYKGLLRLLHYLYEQNILGVTIHCDSALVVNQVNDVWDVNEQSLLPLWREAYGLKNQGNHTLKLVKGHADTPGNNRADELCNALLDLHKEEYEKLFSKT